MSLRRGAAMLAGAVLAVTAALSLTPALAPWTNSTTRSAPIDAAKVGSSLSLTSGAGTVSNASSYQLNGLLFTQYGYLDVLNSSTVPALLTMTVNMGALVAGTRVTACTVPWDTTGSGSCSGTPTVIADAALLSVPSVNYTAVAISPAGAHLYLQCRVAGVAAGIGVVLSPPVVRSPGDRT